MKVVADSHALVWFAQQSNMISETARNALREAEATLGVAVSVATFVDLWYVTQTTKAIGDGELTQLRALLTAPSTGVEIAPISLEAADHFSSIPRSILADPWDRFIVATAMQQAIPLVTRDKAITDARLVSTIW